MKNSTELIREAQAYIECIEKQAKPNYWELYIIGYTDGAEDMRNHIKEQLRQHGLYGKD